MTSQTAGFWQQGRRLRFLVAGAWLFSLGVSFIAGVFAYRHRNQIRSFIGGGVTGAGVIQTNLYNVAVQRLPFPGEGRDGGISALDEGLLVANRRGEMWFVDADRQLEPLSARIPVNVDEFIADPYNANTLLREQFGVKDILVQQLPDGIRLVASHNHWFSDEDCYLLRLSSIELTSAELRTGTDDLSGRWHTSFETKPCRTMGLQGDGVHRNPTIGAGGRMIALSDHEILVTVGGFGGEQIEEDRRAVVPSRGPSVATQDYDNSYGKTIHIDLDTGESRVYTIGHRNPQGLSLAPDGTIWLTEHAERGGDELNRVIEGRNYGFPLVSYGTQYESMVWGSNPRQGRHDGFEKPTYAWVPSIGTSQLVVLRGAAFTDWEGDLLVSGMSARSLFRVRLEDDRVTLVEPILTGHRGRDIAEMEDGTIALKTDDNFVLFLRPLDASSMGDLAPADRGRVLASGCGGCHSLVVDGNDGLGPALWGIVGRDVASRAAFPYSEALASLGGSWTPSRLRAYISNPDSVAPGTQMALTAAYGPQDLDDLVAYLETLR